MSGDVGKPCPGEAEHDGPQDHPLQDRRVLAEPGIAAGERDGGYQHGEPHEDAVDVDRQRSQVELVEGRRGDGGQHETSLLPAGDDEI